MQVAERISFLLVCPSDFVQTSVANGLASAVSAMSQDDAKAYLDKFLAGNDDPRGSGFGLAGIVKGLKTRSLRTHGVLAQLDVMANDKKDQKKREAAMAAYDCLAIVLVCTQNHACARVCFLSVCVFVNCVCMFVRFSVYLCVHVFSVSPCARMYVNGY